MEIEMKATTVDAILSQLATEFPMGYHTSIILERTRRMLKKEVKNLVLSEEQKTVLEEIINQYDDGFQFSNQKRFHSRTCIF